MPQEQEIQFYKNYEIIKHEKLLPYRILFHQHPVLEVQLHWHEDIEFLFILSGQCTIFVEGTMSHLKTGDYILISGRQSHRLKKSADCILCAVQIASDFIEVIFPGFSQKVYSCLHCEDHITNYEKSDSIRSLLAICIFEDINKGTAYKFALLSAINKLILTLIRYFPYKNINESNSINNEAFIFQSRLKTIIEYISKNYEQKITLNELSEKMNLHPNYLSRYFTKYIGIGFQKYLNLFRLQKSLSILAEENSTIAQAAMQSGFADMRTYNSIFRKQLEISPSEWKKKYSHPKVDLSSGCGNIESIKNLSYKVIKYIKAENIENIYATAI